MNFIIKILKKIIISLCILYTFNVLTSKIGFYIPINFYTIFIVTSLDFSGLMVLIFLNML